MSNCDNELNSQIKALHARLDRVDDDLIAHYSAQYLQAISFLANPATATQGTLMVAQFASRSAFKKLVKQLPGYEEFKQLQYLDSASLVESLESTLVQTAIGMVDTAANTLNAAIDAQIAAVRNYSLGLIEQDALNQANEDSNKANAAVSAIKTFLDTLTNISSCKIENSVVGTRPPTTVDLVNTPASISSNITPA